MESLPNARWTASGVTAAGVSIKKEDRGKLSMSDMLKLSKAACKGRDDKFTFFASNEKLLRNFQTVYDLHMRIEAISKDLTYYDMKDGFQIIPAETAAKLGINMDTLFDCQSVAPYMTSHIRHNTVHILLRSVDNILYTAAPYSRIHYYTVGYSTLLENH